MREGNVFYGESAELSQCRVAASIESDPSILQSVLLQQGQPVASDLYEDTSDEKLTILWGPQTVEANFHEDVASDETPAIILGQLVITSEQLLFWTVESASSMREYDLRADATCIDLHALTSDLAESDTGDDENNRSGVYIQLSDGGICDDSGYEALQEITFSPIPSSENQNSQSLFDAISKMIAMNPIDPNDLPDGDAGMMPNFLDDSGNGWFWTGPFMTMNGIQGNEIDGNDDDDDDDHLVVASNNDAVRVTSIDEEEERNRMLERLDRLLVVPPEFEYPDDESVQDLSAGDSQFDDADSDNEGI